MSDEFRAIPGTKEPLGYWRRQPPFLEGEWEFRKTPDSESEFVQYNPDLPDNPEGWWFITELDENIFFRSGDSDSG